MEAVQISNITNSIKKLNGTTAKIPTIENELSKYIETYKH